jgi:hypothetical protein
MGPLRIAFDMDGTLADLSTAYNEVEQSLFGSADHEGDAAGAENRNRQQQLEGEAAAEEVAQKGEPDETPAARRIAARTATLHRERVWRAIEATPNFWTTLQPLEKDAIPRLFEVTGELNWEVFFITQRPATAGGTVQWQTHKWLVEQGFLTPSVIPLSGGRGRAAAALKLDYLVDDTPHNCVDVLSDSTARAILLVDPGDPVAESSARRLGIGVAHSMHEALDILVQATEARNNPSLFEKLRKLVGWR